MWSLLPGGRLVQGHSTGNSIPWSWFHWSSRTGGRLIRVVSLTGFTVLPILADDTVSAPEPGKPGQRTGWRGGGGYLDPFGKRTPVTWLGLTTH